MPAHFFIDFSHLKHAHNADHLQRKRLPVHTHTHQAIKTSVCIRLCASALDRYPLGKRFVIHPFMGSLGERCVAQHLPKLPITGYMFASPACFNHCRENSQMKRAGHITSLLLFPAPPPPPDHLLGGHSNPLPPPETGRQALEDVVRAVLENVFS